MFDLELKNKFSILLSGCGGGYDIFTGLPLYFHLKSNGYRVFLSNFSFTSRNLLNNSELIENSSTCYKIRYKSPGEDNSKTKYFPERDLCIHLNNNYYIDDIVYTITNECSVQYY